MLTTCSSSLKHQLTLTSMQSCATALMRMYATSAAKKPTPPPPHDTKTPTASTATTTTPSTNTSSSSTGTTVDATTSQNVPKSTTATTTTTTETSGSKKNSNIRLVDYLNRKDLEMQRTVVMDMVTKSELKFYDPPYLAREAPFPAYAELNINLKGYEFSVLESYHNFIARLCKSLDVDVKDIYAMPARTYKIKTYRPFSANLDKEYSLKMYHRVVRVKDLKSTTAPLLFEAIQLNLPEGVQLSVGKPTVDEDNFRFVPDLELKDLKLQLEEFEKPPPVATTTGKTPTPATTATSQPSTSSTSAAAPKPAKK